MDLFNSLFPPSSSNPAPASFMERFNERVNCLFSEFTRQNRLEARSWARVAQEALSTGDHSKYENCADIVAKKNNAVVTALKLKRVLTNISVVSNGFQTPMPTLTHASLHTLVADSFEMSDIISNDRQRFACFINIVSTVSSYIREVMLDIRSRAAQFLLHRDTGIAPMLVPIAVKGLHLSTDLLCVSESDLNTKLAGNEQIDSLAAFGLHYECAICNSLLNEPLALPSCSHLPCRSCAASTCAARRTPNYQCAQCRAVTPAALKCNTNLAVARAISNFKIRCPLGCGKVLTVGTNRRDISQHILGECTKPVFQCPQCMEHFCNGLGENAYVKHANEECAMRSVFCWCCEEEMTFRDLQAHMLHGNAPIYENSCNRKIFVSEANPEADRNANGRRQNPGDAHSARFEWSQKRSRSESKHPEPLVCRNQKPCPNRSKGCRHVCNNTTDILDDHIEFCIYRTQPCENAERGCTVEVLVADAETHARSCLFATVSCTHCGSSYLRRDEGEHLLPAQAAEAERGPLCMGQTKCQNTGCTEYIGLFTPAGEAHSQNCPHRHIVCDICFAMFPLNEKDAHDQTNAHQHTLIKSVATAKQEIDALKSQVKSLQETVKVLKSETAANRNALDVHTASVMRSVRLMSRIPESSAAPAVSVPAASAAAVESAANTGGPATASLELTEEKRAMISSLCESDLFSGEQRHGIMNRVGLFYSLNAFPLDRVIGAMERNVQSGSVVHLGEKVLARTAYTHAATGLFIQPVFLFQAEGMRIELRLSLKDAASEQAYNPNEVFYIECAFSVMRRCIRGRSPLTIQYTVPRGATVKCNSIPNHSESQAQFHVVPASRDLMTIDNAKNGNFRGHVTLARHPLETDPIFRSDVGSIIDWHMNDPPANTDPDAYRISKMVVVAIRVLSITKRLTVPTRIVPVARRNRAQRAAAPTDMETGSESEEY